MQMTQQVVPLTQKGVVEVFFVSWKKYLTFAPPCLTKLNQSQLGTLMAHLFHRPVVFLFNVYKQFCVHNNTPTKCDQR